MHFPDTFEAYLKQEQLDAQRLAEEVEVILRRDYERRKSAVLAHDVRSMFRTPCAAGEYRYAGRRKGEPE